MGAVQRNASVAATALVAGLSGAGARAADYKPVTQDMLVNPPAADWLQISRTYDEQRYSPLDQINKSNVAKLQMVFSRGLPPGTQESTPHRPRWRDVHDRAGRQSARHRRDHGR